MYISTMKKNIFYNKRKRSKRLIHPTNKKKITNKLIFIKKIYNKKEYHKKEERPRKKF